MAKILSVFGCFMLVALPGVTNTGNEGNCVPCIEQEVSENMMLVKQNVHRQKVNDDLIALRKARLDSMEAAKNTKP